jgi:hypothetical protein
MADGKAFFKVFSTYISDIEEFQRGHADRKGQFCIAAVLLNTALSTATAASNLKKKHYKTAMCTYPYPHGIP